MGPVDASRAAPPPTPPRRTTLRTVLVLVLGTFAIAGTLVAVVVPGGSRSTTPAPTTEAVAPQAAEPDQPAVPQASSPVVGLAGFPTTDCTPATLAPGSALGIGIPRAARLAEGTPERLVFESAAACLRAISGGTLTLRTQVPIDAARRTSPPNDERAEVEAFAALLTEQAAPGVLSIRAHDFTRCGRGGERRAEEVSELPNGRALRPCEYPTPGLYAELLTELRGMVDEIMPGADLYWTAWNEPDHPMFTLLDGLGTIGAARRAGQYWTQASRQLGPDRVLAGEFSDREPAVLLRLRTAFIEGAGEVPPVWSLHPYRDLTDAEPRAAAASVRFAKAVAPAPVWWTEVTARLSGRGGLSGNPSAQFGRGQWLRDELGREPVRAMLYLLTPPDAARVQAGDTWDSALADRQGRARPFLCGLAGLDPAECPGSPDAFGG
ncbi:MAG: hypothetical protein PGN13_14715 [Patulibacter minatonensis]